AAARWPRRALRAGAHRRARPGARALARAARVLRAPGALQRLTRPAGGSDSRRGFAVRRAPLARAALGPAHRAPGRGARIHVVARASRPLEKHRADAIRFSRARARTIVGTPARE